MIDTAALYHYYLKHPEVTTDSRQVKPGSLFFALKGDRFNGNRYAQKALDAGAAYAIIDEAEFQQGDRFLLVEDVLKSLQDLAAYYRRQFYIPVIGITGSNGKTTTKELLNAVLSSHYQTHFTPGNFNNHIGVPLTLLAMGLQTEVAIIEMGANHVGEIAELSQIAQPTHGIITNIGKAHLEGFGGIEGVKKGKSELYHYLAAHRGVAFINADLPFLSDLSKAVPHRVFYQSSSQPDIQHLAYEMQLLESEPTLTGAFLSNAGELLPLPTQLIGAYNFHNLMTAVAIGRYFKVPDDKIIAGIAAYQSTNNRSQMLHRASNTFILDAYNANPTSMKHALESFAEKKAERKVAILGDMLELGSYSEAEHQQIIEKARPIVGDQLVLVGPRFAEAAQGQGLHCFGDVTELKDWFVQQNYENTLFLLKGSRGMHLEQLLTPSKEQA